MGTGWARPPGLRSKGGPGLGVGRASGVALGVFGSLFAPQLQLAGLGLRLASLLLLLLRLTLFSTLHMSLN
jgi:hypothetical protein